MRTPELRRAPARGSSGAGGAIDPKVLTRSVQATDRRRRHSRSGMGRGHGILVFRRVALLAVLAGLLLLATVGSASAAAPCWKRVSLDWADNGTIDKTYPLPCYTQAIDHQTTTLSLYS